MDEAPMYGIGLSMDAVQYEAILSNIFLKRDCWVDILISHRCRFRGKDPGIVIPQGGIWNFVTYTRPPCRCIWMSEIHLNS